jgi:hypothetical protein
MRCLLLFAMPFLDIIDDHIMELKYTVHQPPSRIRNCAYAGVGWLHIVYKYLMRGVWVFLRYLSRRPLSQYSPRPLAAWRVTSA